MNMGVSYATREKLNHYSCFTPHKLCYNYIRLRLPYVHIYSVLFSVAHESPSFLRKSW